MSSWSLTRYDPAQSFGPTALNHLEKTGDLARAFELGPRALITVVTENSGEPDDRHGVIARRSLTAATQRLREAALADSKIRQLIEAGRDRTLFQLGGKGGHQCV